MPGNLLGELVDNNRPVYKGQTRAQLILARKHCAPSKGRIHLRRLVFSPSAFSLQSDGGPYIFVDVEGRLVKTGLIGTDRSTRRPMSRVLDAVIFRSRWEWPEVVRIHQFIQNCLLYCSLKTMRTGDATDADCCQSNIAASTLNRAAEYPGSQYP